MNYRFFISNLLLVLLLATSSMAQDHLFRNPDEPLDARVEDLISKLTLEEKIGQMMNSSPAIPRLNIPAYDWWNESLHGVGRSAVATVFPQSIGLGATFDNDLVYRISTAISDEARAIYNISVEKEFRQRYSGLTFWSPNVNIFRDPRWGRGQETYGEDPWLMSKMGTAYVKGLQGDDPNYLKAAAGAKHFAVHSGPERLRHEFNAVASQKDMHETYLPAFKVLVENGVETVMCAYNAVNGDPACASDFLLQDLLREQWKFDGHVVSDCGAVSDLYRDNGHQIVDTEAAAAATAVKHGVNLDCGSEYEALPKAVEEGLITEEEIDAKLATLLKTRFRLGMFDPAEMVPYSDIGPEVINSEEHRKLAKEAALKSMVLLKNDEVLPLKKDMARYFVTGPNATSIEAILGNYHGVNPNLTTYLEGLAAKVAPGSQLQYRQGFLLDRPNVNPIDWTTGAAQSSDVIFAVIGINTLLEGEEGASVASEHYGDRLDYQIPRNQIDFLKNLRDGYDKPIVAIVTGGSPLDLRQVHEIADAVIMTWYGGQEAGNALADLVFGDAVPSGRLPITFPKSLEQLPPYEDYSMEGRTYRYMEKEPMYPFGFGLSYTTFTYSDIELSSSSISSDESVEIEATITNEGDLEAEEVTQLYFRALDPGMRSPLYTLRGTKRVKINPGESATVQFTLSSDDLKLVNEEGEHVLKSGQYRIWIGGSLPGERSLQLGGSQPVEATLTVQ